ncbi:MAG: VOC family protein [Candidatus Dormibacter sp.]
MPELDVLGVDNIMLAVGDLGQARAFYETTLGLPVKFAVPQAGIVGYRLGPDEPGLMIRLQAMPPSAPRDTPRIWLEVRDARQATAALRERGARILNEPMEILTGWAVEVSDPWGNVLGLTDYVKDPTRGRKPR